MTQPDLRAVVLAELARIAPDIDPATLGEDARIAHDPELDSVDVLTLVAALHDRLGVDMPEADDPQTATPPRAVACLRRATEAAG